MLQQGTTRHVANDILLENVVLRVPDANSNYSLHPEEISCFFFTQPVGKMIGVVVVFTMTNARPVVRFSQGRG